MRVTHAFTLTPGDLAEAIVYWLENEKDRDGVADMVVLGVRCQVDDSGNVVAAHLTLEELP